MDHRPDREETNRLLFEIREEIVKLAELVLRSGQDIVAANKKIATLLADRVENSEHRDANKT